MTPIPLRLLCPLFLLLVPLSRAQTDTWIARGPNGSFASWADPANWDTGTVPNSPGAAVAVPSLSIDPFAPGAAGVEIDGVDVTVGSLTFVPVYPAGVINIVMIGRTAPGLLRIVGSGAIVPANRIGQFVIRRGSLDFADHAVAAGSGAGLSYFQIQGGVASPAASLIFRDNSSAGSSWIEVGGGGVLEFRDFSTADTARLIITGSNTVARFQDHASSENALVSLGSGGTLAVSDDASVTRLVVGTDPTGGTLDISGARGPLVSVKSLAGTVNLRLGANTLRLGDLPDNTSLDFQGKISGTGGLVFDSPTHTTVNVSNAASDYTGATAIASPSLRVMLAGGSLNRVTLTQQGFLGGNGAVRDSLSLLDGTVQPGHNGLPGTIAVQGDYVQTSNGTLKVRIASTTGYDRLTVGGTAAIDGGLVLTVADGFVPVGTVTFNVLAAGSLTGQFASISLPADFGAALTNRVSYSGSGVRFVITQHPFSGFGSSAAGTSLGAHFDTTLANATGNYRATLAGLNTLNATNLAAALDAIAPDRYAALAENGRLTAAAHAAGRDRRFAALRDQPGHGLDASFTAGARSARFDAISGLPAAESTLHGGTLDLAWRNEACSIGISLTRETGEATLDAFGSRADISSLAPAVSWQYSTDRFFVNAAAAFSRDDYDLRRRVIYAGFDQTALASPAGRRTDLELTAGYIFRTGSWRFTPQAGLLDSNWKVDDFVETGAAGASLAVPNWSDHSLRARLGFELSTAGRTFRPHLTVLWWHDLRNNRSFQAAAGGSPYAVPGRPGEPDLLQAGLGFDRRLGSRLTLSANATLFHGKNSSVTSDLSAALRWEF